MQVCLGLWIRKLVIVIFNAVTVIYSSLEQFFILDIHVNKIRGVNSNCLYSKRLEVIYTLMERRDFYCYHIYDLRIISFTNILSSFLTKEKRTNITRCTVYCVLILLYKGCRPFLIYIYILNALTAPLDVLCCVTCGAFFSGEG